MGVRVCVVSALCVCVLVREWAFRCTGSLGEGVSSNLHLDGNTENRVLRGRSHVRDAAARRRHRLVISGRRRVKVFEEAPVVDKEFLDLCPARFEGEFQSLARVFQQWREGKAVGEGRLGAGRRRAHELLTETRRGLDEVVGGLVGFLHRGIDAELASFDEGVPADASTTPAGTIAHALHSFVEFLLEGGIVRQ